VEAAAFALAGVLVGVLITSGYNFWTVRRQELVRGSGAARALDDEMHWMASQLSKIVAGERNVHLDAASSVSVWREHREALVLWTDAETFRKLGDALRVPESLDGQPRNHVPRKGDSGELDETRAALAALEEAGAVLRSLSDYLWSEHEIFILTTLFKSVQRALKRMRGVDTRWQPPGLATELVWREAPADTRCEGRLAKLCASRSTRPGSAVRGTVDDAEERPDRQLDSPLKPRLQLLPAPCVHTDLAAASALAATDEQRAAAVIQISFGKRERFLDA